jgi:basic membrane lipoprotein Med (substrate-binding protein (PBP1-ABC) superfamily)
MRLSFAALAAVLFSASASAEELKVAYIPCGKVNDQSWSQAGYMGAQGAQKELEAKGVKMKLDYSESLPPSQVEAAARDYASRGYQIVVFHCGTFADAAVAAAKGFPKTKFLFATTPPPGALPENFWAYDVAQNEASFVSGYLAALVSKSGQVGAVGAFDFPVLTRQMEGFRLGARYANPKIKTYSAFINSWEDAGKAKEATRAQIDAGADVVFAATDQAARGVFSAAEDAGVYAIASYADQSNLAPNAIVTSAIYDFIKLLKEMIVNAQAEKLEKGKFYRVGLDGYSFLVANKELSAKVVSPEVQAKVDALIADIQSGKLKVPELTTSGASETFDVKTMASN